jgi:hypothetical protein
LGRLDHDEVHRKMQKYSDGINLFGFVLWRVVFKHPTKQVPKTPTQLLGRTAKGRAAIAAGLTKFYSENDWLPQGQPSIFSVLLKEVPRYIYNHHSAPVCKKL